MSYHSPIKQRLYYGLPYPLKCALATAYGTGQRKSRYGVSFRETLAELRESQYAGAASIERYEKEVLGGFLETAIEKAPYYRGQDAYRSARTRADLQSLPVLEKKVLQDHLDSFLADGFRESPHQWGHTSGTTGRALVFPISSSCFQREYAFRALHYSWGGVDITSREPMAFCSGHPVAYRDRACPPFWTWDAANNWLLLSSYHLSPQNLSSYIRKLESFQPVMLGGYPSSLYLLALAYRRHGRGTLRLKSVFTASESLLDHQREAMEEAFGVHVFNWYGNSEMCGHITECEKGRLHVRHEHSLLEVLNRNGAPCAPGESGSLVATGFHNFAFPLIRYRVGDEVTLSAESSCPCGRGGLLVERIEGRNEDYVVTPDGRLIGRLDHLFKDSQQVEEAQIRQESPEKVLLRVVRKAGYGDADEKQILGQARLRLGSEIKVAFEYPESIERTASGKFRFIDSTVDRSYWTHALAGD